MTSIERREPPPSTHVQRRDDFTDQGILDLSAGRHAVGCECERDAVIHNGDFVYNKDGTARMEDPNNACSTIAKALKEFTAYEVEV